MTLKPLLLTMKKEPFTVMISGEKTSEYRRPSKWIESRLIGREYDLVKFVNGYGKDKPYFVAEYKGYFKINVNERMEYSNGFTVDLTAGDYAIQLGNIIETGNS